MHGSCGGTSISTENLGQVEPFRELDLMARGCAARSITSASPRPLLPAVDVYETEDEFVPELEVPGYEERELTIEALDHTVAIAGERREVEEKADKVFRLQERLEKQFERRFELPPEAARAARRPRRARLP